MKNILKKLQIIYFVLWLWVSFWSYYYFVVKKDTSSSSWNTQTIEVASIWNLSQSIKVLWSAELVDEQQLRFNKTWKVTKVYIKEWEQVEKDQILAELDKQSVNFNIEQARLNLENAKLRLSDLYSGLDTSKKLDYERNIEQSEKNLEIQKKELEILKASQETSINKLKKDIEYKNQDISILEKSLGDQEKSYNILAQEQQNNLKNTSLDIENTIKDLKISIEKDIKTAEESIEQMDVILWVTDKNRTLNDSYEIYLSAKNTSYKNEASSLLSSSIGLLNTLKAKDKDNFKEFFWDLSTLFETLYKASDATYKALDNSVESSSFSSSEISSKKSSMSSLRSKMQSNIQNTLTYEKKIETLTDIDLYSSNQSLSLSKASDSIESIKNNLAKAKNDLETLKKNLEEAYIDNKLKLESKENSIKNATASLEILKLTYKEALAGPTASSVANIQNEVKKAELSLSDALKEWENYELKAPFSGVVRKIDLQVWDNLATDNSKYVYLENPNLLEIPVLLDQVDIVKVSLWQKAYIKFDAYPTEKIEGEIRFIDYTPVQSSGVVNYRIKIVITDPDFDKKVLSWMTADIEIITLEKTWVILISTSAINTTNWKSFVQVEWKGRQEIEIWVSNSWKTEVVSWLNSWDRVIINTVQVLRNTQTNSSQNSLINIPWTTWTMRGSMWGGFR